MGLIHMQDILPLIGVPLPPPGRSSYNIPCPCCDENPRKRHLNINLKKDVFAVRDVVFRGVCLISMPTMKEYRGQPCGMHC